jgi:hypothetical protein
MTEEKRPCQSYVTEVPAGLRFCHLEAHFMKPSDYHKVVLNKVLGFMQGEGLLDG